MKYRTAQAWLQDGRALVLPAAMSEAFDDHIDSLPWSGTTGLDWSRIGPFRELNLAGRSPVDVFDWITTTSLGSRGYISIWYSRASGGIIVPLREGVMALDELYWDAAGPRFAFSVELKDGTVQPFYSDVLEYGHGERLIATA